MGEVYKEMKKLHRYFKLVDEKGKSYGKYRYGVTALSDKPNLEKVYLTKLKLVKVVVDKSDDTETKGL